MTDTTTTFDRADTSLTQRWRDPVFRVWIAVFVLGTGLFANQYVTLRKLKTLLLERAPGDPVAALAQKVWQLVADVWQTFLTPADLAITAAIVLPLAYIVYAEVTRGTMTELLHRAERSPRLLLTILTVGTLVVTRTYMTPGRVFMGDSETHMLRSWMFAEHFRHFATPVWSNAWYGGFPLLANYGPLYFAVTAALSLLFGNIDNATKVLLWACHVGSVLGMFLLIKTVTRAPLAALVAAFAYALSFHRLHILLYQGDLQVAVLFLLLPFILLTAERFIRERQHARRAFVVSSLLLAVMILNHHGYAFFGLVFTAIYLTVRLALSDGHILDRFKVLVFFALTQVAALLTSAFLIVPFLFETDEHRGMPNSALPILVPNPLGPIMLIKLFRWANIGDGGSIGYMGLSIGVLAVWGAVYGLRRKDPVVAGCTAAAVASLLMVKDHVSYNVKNINFFMVFIAALSAWALLAVVQPTDGEGRFANGRRRWRERFPARTAAILLALIFLDLGPTTFQSVYRENYEFKQPMYDRVLALGEPYKVVERQVLTYDPNRPPDAFFDPRKIGVPSAYASTQTPLGFFHEGAGRSFGYHAELVKLLHRDLNAGRISPDAAEGLYVMGVKYVIFRDRYRWFTPSLEPSPAFALQDGILRLAHATPLLLSTRVISTRAVAGYPATDLMVEGRYLEDETFDYDDRYYRELVQPLIKTMGLDMPRGVARTLIARDEGAVGDLGPVELIDAQILDFSTSLKRVDVRYRSTHDAIGQLPYTFFPHLRVEIDGARTPFFRSAMDQILVRVPAGDHTVTIHGLMPPLQYRMAWLSAISLLAVLFVPTRVFHFLER
jgi:6-pyruvoyl-tetrahydropterin synthase related domain